MGGGGAWTMCPVPLAQPARNPIKQILGSPTEVMSIPDILEALMGGGSWPSPPPLPRARTLWQVGTWAGGGLWLEAPRPHTSW